MSGKKYYAATSGAASTTSVQIGLGSACNDSNCAVLGALNNSNGFNGSCLIGNGNTAGAANQVIIGVGTTGTAQANAVFLPASMPATNAGPTNLLAYNSSTGQVGTYTLTPSGGAWTVDQDAGGHALFHLSKLDFQDTVGGTNRAILIGGSDTTGTATAVSIGHSATASDTNAVSIGSASTASGGSSVGIGNSCAASNGASVSIGLAATCTGADSVAIGNTPVARGLRSVIIGYNATDTDVTNTQSVCIGTVASVNGTNNVGCVVIGSGASVTGTGSTSCVAIGVTATANGPNVIVIGNASTSTAGSDIVIGNGSFSTGSNGIAIGTGASSGGGGLCIGNSSTTSTNSTAVGYLAHADGTSTSVLGATSSDNSNGGCSILGPGWTAGASGQLLLGYPGFTASAVTNGAFLQTNVAAVATGAPKALTFDSVTGQWGPVGSTGANFGGFAAFNVGSLRFSTALASGNTGIVIGSNTTTAGVSSVGVGHGSLASGTQNVVVGDTATAAGLNNQTVVGYGAAASGSANQIVLGQGATAATAAFANGVYLPSYLHGGIIADYNGATALNQNTNTSSVGGVNETIFNMIYDSSSGLLGKRKRCYNTMQLYSLLYNASQSATQPASVFYFTASSNGVSSNPSIFNPPRPMYLQGMCARWSGSLGSDTFGLANPVTTQKTITTITSAADNVTVTTSNGSKHNFQVGDYVNITGVTGVTGFNGFYTVATPVADSSNPHTFHYTDTGLGTQTGTVSGSTKATGQFSAISSDGTTTTVTWPNHNFLMGDVITVSGVTGNTTFNGGPFLIAGPNSQDNRSFFYLQAISAGSGTIPNNGSATIVESLGTQFTATFGTFNSAGTFSASSAAVTFSPGNQTYSAVPTDNAEQINVLTTPILIPAGTRCGVQLTNPGGCPWNMVGHNSADMVLTMFIGQEPDALNW